MVFPMYGRADGSKKGGIKGIVLVLLLVAGVGAYLVWCYIPQMIEKKAQEKAGQMQKAQASQLHPAIPVVVDTVKMTDLAAARRYVGRVEPLQMVQLRPEVSGTIAKVHFKEGSMVKAGDLLFTLEDKSFRAHVASCKATLGAAQANYDRALKYDKRIQKADSRSVSASKRDIAASDVIQAKAAVAQAKAALHIAQINLGYTKIKAPISGKVGKALFTKGNYVTPAGGALTSIVQEDPIRVTFALSDKDYLEQIEAFNVQDKPVYNAEVTLANGVPYEGKGYRDFESNTMDQNTGTITVALRFKNPQRKLVPGSVVRLSLKPAKSQIMPYIPQEAVMADQKGDYVYVVNGADKVERRSITIYRAIQGVFTIKAGLEEGERIVFQGLQKVRPGVVVKPLPRRVEKAKSPAEKAAESLDDVKPLVAGQEQ